MILRDSGFTNLFWEELSQGSLFRCFTKKNLILTAKNVVLDAGLSTGARSGRENREPREPL